LSASDSRAGLAVRQQAATRLQQVLAGGDFAPFSASEIADGRDRALANRLVTTALRRHGHINGAMARLLDRGPPKRAGSFEAQLRLGLAQLLYLPEQGEHSAVHLAVEAVKRDPRAQRYAGLMNAALRRAQADAQTLRALPRDMLLPRQLQERWARDWGREALAAAIDNLVEGAALDLTLRDADAELLAALGARPLLADSVRLDTRDRPVAGLPGFDTGRWWVQDLAAALPARLVHLPAGARVLDLCAAPGGKTMQLCKAGYAVTALDDSAPRLALLRENLARTGYAATLVEADATAYRPETAFDGVLLDAPCSATGTFRRHPEVLWHRGAERIANRAALQRRLLAQAAACLNPGGVLVYCVCSLERAEGEEQLGWIAANLPELVPDPVEPEELPALPGAVTAAGAVRTHPGLAVAGERRGTLDGFFVARFRRRLNS
jgi:16S rRNA (cytosine967-C5)-methyltransferase